MEVSVEHGLRVAEVDLDEWDAVHAQRPDHDVNVYRITHPGLISSPPKGMLLKPSWVNWMASVPDGSKSLLQLQSKRQKERTRAALRSLAKLTTRVDSPVTEATFAEWLKIYSDQTARMPRGFNVAAAEQSEVLDRSSGHLLITWWDGTRLIGGCVSVCQEGGSIFQGRFSASIPDARNLDLARAMYVSLADQAFRGNFKLLSLGNDLNFYGHIVRPGLCGFKMRLGFRPVPSQFFNPFGETVAERVNSLNGLEEPVILFAHERAVTNEASAEDYLAAPADAAALVQHAFMSQHQDPDFDLTSATVHIVNSLPTPLDRSVVE